MSTNNPKINNEIRALELRVIDESGNNLGVLGREEALRLAQEKSTDLVEVSPAAKPPVARLISFDKYRYQREKELKKQRQAQKTAGLKQIQLTPRIAYHDLMTKKNRAEEFLEKGNQVEIFLRLRGREKAHKDVARQKLAEFLKMITLQYKVLNESAPKAPEIKILIKKI